MGEVWRGRHQTLSRPTAIKLIREDRIKGVAADHARRVLRRFEREAKATAALRSPHTIEVYDFGVTGDGHFFYAMEFLDGLDLQSLVERFGPVPGERVVHLLIQACDSLADAHDHGMIHRDIKPANMFLCRLGPSRDHIKLLDFGLVQHNEAVTQCGPLTEEGTTAGTPAYMAPETFVGENAVDNRSDIYALGCVAYWLAAGTLVFQTESSRAQIVEHVKTTPEPPSARTELPIPSELEAIIMKCLEKDPADRFKAREKWPRCYAKFRSPRPGTPGGPMSGGTSTCAPRLSPESRRRRSRPGPTPLPPEKYRRQTDIRRRLESPPMSAHSCPVRRCGGLCSFVLHDGPGC